MPQSDDRQRRGGSDRPSERPRRIRRPKDAEPRDQPRQHDWQAIRLGRTCRNCHLTQATGEFDDTTPCTAPA